MKQIIFIYLFILCTVVYAQKQDNILCVGGYEGLIPNKPDFGTSFLGFSNKDTLASFSPEAKGAFRFEQTCASICDKTGKLAFYTNGLQIENGSFDVIPSQLTATSLVTQSTLLLPFPEKDSLYLMLYEFPINNPTISSKNSHSAEIFYAIIDMSKNEGRGSVIESEKRIPKVIDEYYPCLGKLCAIKQPNGIDWWIFIMENEANVFHKYQLTKSGLSYVNKQTYGNPAIDGVGAANFSPNGKYHARYNNIRSDKGQYLDVYDFDRCTGKFSNQRSVFYINHGGSGVTFSPNSRFLYVAIYDLVLQYDMESSDFKASEKIVAQYDGFITCKFNKANFYNCQLAPDNKIYICTSTCSKHLHVIEKPDLPDTLCQVRQHSIELPTYISSSLPNFPNFRLGKAECKIGVEELVESEINIYPNPAGDNFSIEIPKAKNVFLDLYNIQGQFVLSQKEMTQVADSQYEVNVAHLPKGIYLLKINLDGKIDVRKIVVE